MDGEESGREAISYDSSFDPQKPILGTIGKMEVVRTTRRYPRDDTTKVGGKVSTTVQELEASVSLLVNVLSSVREGDRVSMGCGRKRRRSRRDKPSCC